MEIRRACVDRSVAPYSRKNIGRASACTGAAWKGPYNRVHFAMELAYFCY